MEYISDAATVESQENEREESLGTPGRFLFFIGVIQTLLFLVHWYVLETFLAFWGSPALHPAVLALLVLLSVSFVGASILAWRTYHPAARVLYALAAIWVGAL